MRARIEARMARRVNLDIDECIVADVLFVGLLEGNVQQ